MSNKKTALDWLESQQEIQDMINVYSCDAQLFLRMVFNKAKAMEKEQIIKFANKVLDNAECSFTGTPYLEKDINEIYKETYEQ